MKIIKKSLSIFLCIGFIQFNYAQDESNQQWNNPGGMWRPKDMDDQSELLKKLGLEIDPKELADPASNLLQSVVSLGYCSGSFISNNGLIITNHHCVASMLSFMSNDEKEKNPDSTADYNETGFYAQKMHQERFAGPTERIFVTQGQEDVTDFVLNGLDKINDPIQKSKLISDRINEIVTNAQEANDKVKASVKSFFRNKQFLLITQLELKKVKVVYAPPKSIGNYGGDTDNWRYPRHVADFALIRAYEEDGTPYKPKNILKIASDNNSWVKPESFIMVAGYPGRTNRLITYNELEDQIKNILPTNIKKYDLLLETLNNLSGQNSNNKTKLESKIKSINNSLKNWKEKLTSIERVGFLEKKQVQEKQLIDWDSSQEEAINEINQKYLEFSKNRITDSINSDLMYGYTAGLVHLIQTSMDIVRMSIEREKPDDKRLPQFQEKNWQAWIEDEQSIQKTWDPEIAKSVLKWTLDWALSFDTNQIPASIHQLFDVEKAKKDKNVVKNFIKQIFTDQELSDVTFRIYAFKEFTTAQLKDLNNPLINLAFSLIPELEKIENNFHYQRGLFLDCTKKYISGLQDFHLSQLNRPLADDANSTLRLTFGNVRGLVGPVSKKQYPPFTSIVDFSTKHKWGDHEFEASTDILRALHLRQFDKFTDDVYGQVPVDFLAVVDTTGGNSGSAALNSKGELIGLLFDGMDETLYSDYYFNGEEVRSILVDIRYVLWVLKNVAHADRIFEEIWP